MDDEIKTEEILTIQVAVTALEEPDQFGVLLIRDIDLPPEQCLLRTPAGKLVQSDNYGLMRHLVLELEEHPVLHVRDRIIIKPRPLSSYLLYATEKDFGDSELKREDTDHILRHDPVLHPSAGQEWLAQLRYWGPLDEFLQSLGAELHPQVHYGKKEWDELVDALTNRWNKLSPMGKSVVTNLQNMTNRHTIAALALASGACSASEFGHAVLAASLESYIFEFPNDDMTAEEQHAETYRYYRDLARVCMDYLSFFPTDTIAVIVSDGESNSVEFKSSLRWDIRKNQKDDTITHASLKTISAFLNTRGGTLLIGVGDDGAAVGIEVDGFPNDDKFLLHLYGVIKSSMGTDVTPLIEADIDMFDGKKVCHVRCESSHRPVYLKAKGKGEEFYIRTGPSSERLDPSKLMKYIPDRFGNP